MTKIGEVRIPPRAVHWLGICLIAAGLVIPVAVIWSHAASRRPAERGPVKVIGPEMVILNAGTFDMGSPEGEAGGWVDEALHKVTLTRDFIMSRTETTQQQYFEIMGQKPWERTDSAGDDCSAAGVGDHLPVVCVSWREAVEFCNALSMREGLEPAYELEGETVTWHDRASGYRLPTEAEWEYAARAGTRHRFVGTDDEAEVCGYANVADASAKAKNPEWTTFSCDDGFTALAPVEAKLANRWQVYGMGGNAREWVWDTYSIELEGPVEDPALNDPNASARVIRGGSWGGGPRNARVANRSKVEPSDRLDVLGFRIARSLP